MSTSRPRRRKPREYRGPARSCEHCFGWGVLRQRICRGCENFAAKYPVGSCRTCQRAGVPVRDAVCRLCRKQAGFMAGPDNKVAVDLSVAALTGQQLFLADMTRSLRMAYRPPAIKPPPTPALSLLARPHPMQTSTQLLLFDPPRDCRHASSLDPPRDPAFLDLVLRHADSLAERNGWPPRTLQQVRRGLRMLASGHDPGEPIKASTVTAMSPHGVPGLRVLEVLTAAGDGLVVDDRPDSLAVWIEQKFQALPLAMREELRAWIDVLRQGTPRRKARPRVTAFTLLSAVRPFLLDCATRYATLRQVTREDVTGWLDGRKQRSSDASALQDLFRVLKTRRLVFANPTYHIRVSGQNPSTPIALSVQALLTLGQAAEHDPALRVVLALVGVHALQPHRVRRMTLDELDLPNRRVDLDGVRRSLDPFTVQAITSYLGYRHDRWPGTSNPHLLLTRRTAHEHGPVSEYWLSGRLRGLPATLRQLREDRILDEARAAGGDPLHLAAMFGLSAKPTLRYAQTVHPGLAALHNGDEPTCH